MCVVCRGRRADGEVLAEGGRLPAARGAVKRALGPESPRVTLSHFVFLFFNHYDLITEQNQPYFIFFIFILETLHI